MPFKVSQRCLPSTPPRQTDQEQAFDIAERLLFTVSATKLDIMQNFNCVLYFDNPLV